MRVYYCMANLRLYLGLDSAQCVRLAYNWKRAPHLPARQAGAPPGLAQHAPTLVLKEVS